MFKRASAHILFFDILRRRRFEEDIGENAPKKNNTRKFLFQASNLVARLVLSKRVLQKYVYFMVKAECLEILHAPFGRRVLWAPEMVLLFDFHSLCSLFIESMSNQLVVRKDSSWKIHRLAVLGQSFTLERIAASRHLIERRRKCILTSNSVDK